MPRGLPMPECIGKHWTRNPVLRGATCMPLRPAIRRPRRAVCVRSVAEPLPTSTSVSPPPAFFRIVWPEKFKGKLDATTLERVYEVFDFALWDHHRSRYRYLEHLSTLFGSYFLKDLAAPILTVMAIAGFVGLYETGLERGWLPSMLPNIALAAPEPFSITSFALSLMLVFRTNSSYARWLEARCLWGSLVNRCRNLGRQAVMLLPLSKANIKDAILKWSAIYPRTLKAHLRQDGSMEELKDLLTTSELTLLAGSTHRPLTVLQVLSRLIRNADLDPISTSRLDINLEVMEDIMGGCERILKTPIPLSYTRHTARFLTIWLAFLPFTLWESVRFGVIPASGLIAFLLLGIDEIAIQMEEPFGILPLEAICDTVARNIEEIKGSESRVKEAVDRALLLSLKRDHGVAGRSASVDYVNPWDDADAEASGTGAHWGQAGSLDMNDSGHWAAVPLRERSIDDYS